MDLYEMMDLYLEIDKDLKSVVYVIKVMENSYSEEDNAAQKYLCNSILLSLNNVESKLNYAISLFDEYIIKSNAGNK